MAKQQQQQNPRTATFTPIVEPVQVQQQLPTPDVSGRLDVLAQRIVERIAVSSPNPLVQVVYPVYRDTINLLLEKALAPRDRRGRILKLESQTRYSSRRVRSPKARKGVR